jgi:phage baseplate assembly protein W
MAEAYTDIDFGFGLDSTGDIKLATNGDAIRQSIQMILFTRLGLRPGTKNENFGTDTLSYLFAPVTKNTANYLGETILLALKVYEPRIEIVNINISLVDDKSYDINIEYEVLIPEEVGLKSFRITLESL